MRKALLVGVCLAAILGLDLWVHGSMAAALLTWLHHNAPHPLEHPFWDAQVYATGIRDYLAGRSPYSLDDLSNPLPFAYPPAFVWAGAALAKAFPAPRGWHLYVVIYLVATFGLQMLLAPFYLRKLRPSEIFGLLCLLPLAAYMSTALLSGNIHGVWYFAAALAAIPGLRRDQWLWFYIITCLAMINQPVFALLLLFPYFAGAKQLIPSALTAMIAAAAYAAQRLLNPAMFALFQQTVAAHLQASRDFGEGIFAICAAILAHFGYLGTTLPAIPQLAFSGSVIAVLFWMRHRTAPQGPRWWALIVLAIVLVNPRIMLYDAVIALIPAIYFLIYDLRRAWLIILPAVAACVAWHSPAGFTPLLLAAFAVGVISAAAPAYPSPASPPECREEARRPRST